MCYLIGNPADVRLCVFRDIAHFLLSHSPFLFFPSCERVVPFELWITLEPFKENRDNVLTLYNQQYALLDNYWNKVIFLVRSPNTLNLRKYFLPSFYV